MRKELKAYKGYRIFKTIDEYGDVYYFFLEKNCNDNESEYYFTLAECHKAVREWIDQTGDE